MIRKLLAMAVLTATFGGGSDIYAQFYTVVDKRNSSYEILPKTFKVIQNNDSQIDELGAKTELPPDSVTNICVDPDYKISPKEPVRKKHLALFKTYDGLPGLTINNLLNEIRKCGIKHEKIVLAQAILETGWFTSSVCRNKNNLFGLTNPRTGQYYEFDHWTESVKAYYTKVQYRYKGGNYLLWLDDIGYAEKKTYVQSLIRLLEQYFI